jgi:hypothetical protein
MANILILFKNRWHLYYVYRFKDITYRHFPVIYVYLFVLTSNHIFPKIYKNLIKIYLYETFCHPCMTLSFHGRCLCHCRHKIISIERSKKKQY